MREHVRVLQARVQPGALERRGLRRERARDGDEHEREEDGDAAEHGHAPGDEVGRAAPVDQDRGRGVRRSSTSSQRSSEPSCPPRRRTSSSPSAARSTCAARRTRTRSRAGQRREQNRGGDRGRAERREQRVAGGVGEPALVRVRRPRADDRRVEREPERDEQRGAAEVGHALRCLSSWRARTSTGTS